MGPAVLAIFIEVASLDDIIALIEMKEEDIEHTLSTQGTQSLTFWFVEPAFHAMPMETVIASAFYCEVC
jgi:hypothetical protein